MAEGEAGCRGGFHWAVMSGDLGVAGFIALVVGLVLVRNELSREAVVELLVAGGLPAMAFVARGWRRWRQSEFAVAGGRLTIRIGGFRERRIEVPLDGVAVEVRVPWRGKLFGYGTVLLETREGRVEELRRVAQPAELASAITRAARGRNR